MVWFEDTREPKGNPHVKLHTENKPMISPRTWHSEGRFLHSPETSVGPEVLTFIPPTSITGEKLNEEYKSGEVLKV